VTPGAPLTLARGDEDGWVALACGPYAVSTYVARVRGTEAPLALAVLTEGGHARV